MKDEKNAPLLELSAVKKASEACESIMMWVNGIHDFYWVNKDVKPKKVMLA